MSEDYDMDAEPLLRGLLERDDLRRGVKADVEVALADVERLRARRDRYREVLERIGRVHGPWRAVVADVLGCTVDDLDPRKQP